MSKHTEKTSQQSETKIALPFDELPKRNRLLTPKQGQKTAYILLASSAIFIFLVIALFIGFIVVNGIANFSFRLLFSPFNPTTEQYGIGPAILGTFLLVAGSVAIALPLGVLAAIYLTEYTKGGIIVNIIDQGINNLAGVPSVVIGVFGYTFFSIFLKIGQSMVAGWLTLACMLLPTIIRTSQEALKNVPQSYREGSLALGITKWRTIRYVVLPSALPGILTGAILSLGRAAGETAAVLFVGSGALFIKWFGGFTGTFTTLPYMILHLYRSSGGWEEVGSVMWQIAFVLMLIVFGFNAIAMVLRNRFEKKRTGN